MRSGSFRIRWVLDEDDPRFLCEVFRQVDWNMLFSRRGLSGNQLPGPTVVNAFRGMENMIRQGSNAKFWFGLPEFAFDQSLLWYPCEPLQRRKHDGKALFKIDTRFCRRIRVGKINYLAFRHAQPEDQNVMLR